MDDDELPKEEETSKDLICPRCGLRIFEEICPNCGTPIIAKADDEDEEYDWRESMGANTVNVDK